MIPRSENIKKFSGKRAVKGVDPNLSSIYTDRLLGSRYQFRLDRSSGIVYLIVHQSGQTIYSKGRSIPIGSVTGGVFSLYLLIGDVPVHYVCQLVGSNIQSLQTKAIAFIQSLNLSTPRKVTGGKAVIEKRARRARRTLKGIEIR